jgi:ABC-2 type transport system permease protein
MNRLTDNSLFQLTCTRFRLFFREPEAVFWIFVFPILLAVGLSFAFRNRPADVLQVGATTAQLARGLNADNGPDCDGAKSGRRQKRARDRQDSSFGSPAAP